MASVCSQVPRNWKNMDPNKSKRRASEREKSQKKRGLIKQSISLYARNQESVCGHGREMRRSRLMRWTSLHGSLGGSLSKSLRLEARDDWPVDEKEVAQDYGLMLMAWCCVYAHCHLTKRENPMKRKGVATYRQTKALSIFYGPSVLRKTHEAVDSRSSQLQQAWKARSTIWI